MRFLSIATLLALLAGPAARAQDVVDLTSRPPAPYHVLIRDGVAGALLGSAVAGGLVAYNMGFEGRAGYDWGKALAWGAGIGVGAGLVLGMFEVATTRRRPIPQALVRDGLSRSLDARARDQSHSHLFPLLSRTF
jgi:hypothetical protein